MKNSIVVLCLLMSCSNLFGQDYLAYYQLCNEADEQIYLKNYALALQKFELAFKDVSYVYCKKYEQASKCAILIEDYEKAYSFICQLRKQGHNNDFLNDKQFNSFKKTEYYQRYQDSIESYDAIRQSALNQEYMSLIDSLIYIDQYVIRKNREYKGQQTIDEALIPDDVWDLQPFVFQSLLEAANKYGFPSEKMLDEERLEDARTILLHNLRLKENIEYHNWAFEAVLNGDYQPSDYAVMYEQYYLFEKKKAFYTTLDKNLSAENLTRLDVNRAKIGLPPIRAYKIKKGGYKPIYLWGRF